MQFPSIQVDNSAREYLYFILYWTFGRQQGHGAVRSGRRCESMAHSVTYRNGVNRVTQPSRIHRVHRYYALRRLDLLPMDLHALWLCGPPPGMEWPVSDTHRESKPPGSDEPVVVDLPPTYVAEPEEVEAEEIMLRCKCK